MIQCNRVLVNKCNNPLKAMESVTEPGTGGGRVKTPGEARGESPTETIVPEGRLVIQTYANLTQLTHENPGS